MKSELQLSVHVYMCVWESEAAQCLEDRQIKPASNFKT